MQLRPACIQVGGFNEDPTMATFLDTHDLADGASENLQWCGREPGWTCARYHLRLTKDVQMVRDGAASERLAYLIGRVAMRDRAAFKELYDLTHRFLFRVAIGHLKNTNRAEDVLQESFMEAWQKAATYSATISKPMTWLITIVSRRSIDEYRRLVREGRVIDPVAVDDPETDRDVAVVFPDSIRELFGADVMNRLERCFEQLSVDQRRAIRDIRVHGMTYDEAARIYKLPRQTVASWVRRGIATLTGCMQS